MPCIFPGSDAFPHRGRLGPDQAHPRVTMRCWRSSGSWWRWRDTRRAGGIAGTDARPGCPTAASSGGTILGLIFGVATATRAFSGMLSLDPFPSATPRGPAGRGPDLAEALRGEVALDDFAALSPGDLLARHPDLEVKAVELTAFDGRPLYAARLGDGATVMFGIDGRRVDRFDHDAIARIVRRVAPDAGAVGTRILDRYDRYYLDRRRARPLPVILAQLHDDAATRYYIDPATARVVGQYSNRRWVSRWLYSGLHSLNFRGSTPTAPSGTSSSSPSCWAEPRCA